MTDIAKCTGKGCEKRIHCYRYTAPRDPLYQAWFSAEPLDKDGNCEYYVDNGGMQIKYSRK